MSTLIHTSPYKKNVDNFELVKIAVRCGQVGEHRARDG